jgi:hypothetical protein
MNAIPVRAASRLWFRMDVSLRAASLAWLRWRLVLAPILPL